MVYKTQVGSVIDDIRRMQMSSATVYIYNWNLQKINAGGKTNGPPALVGIVPFVSVFLNAQLHVFYVDEAGNIWDAYYDAGAGSWNLQKINAGGKTNGPPAAALAYSG